MHISHNIDTLHCTGTIFSVPSQSSIRDNMSEAKADCNADTKVDFVVPPLVKNQIQDILTKVERFPRICYEISDTNQALKEAETLFSVLDKNKSILGEEHLILALSVHLAVGGKKIMLDRMYKHQIVKEDLSFNAYLSILTKAKQILDDAGVIRGVSRSPTSSSSSASRAMTGSAAVRNAPAVTREARAPPQASIGDVGKAASPLGPVIYLPETATMNASRRIRYSIIGNQVSPTDSIFRFLTFFYEIRKSERSLSGKLPSLTEKFAIVKKRNGREQSRRNSKKHAMTSAGRNVSVNIM